eukprot:Nitzschia sp. Nitz4//scaffold12_size214221//67319//71587//NITZ4_001491-RA/size214221-processed-gene-0.153-mRNA-1//-1//CDS//3329534993//13//frame0
MSFAEDPRDRPSLQSKESFRNINKVTVAPGVSLSGDDLEKYCHKKGLCPLCAKTKIKRRELRLGRRPRFAWKFKTEQNKDGSYKVYKGYCVSPDCFTLRQAIRLAGDSTGSSSKMTSDSSVNSSKLRKGVGSSFNDSVTSFAPDGGGEIGDHVPSKARDGTFPPSDFDKSNIPDASDDHPHLIVLRATDGLARNSREILHLDLSSIALHPIDLKTLATGLKPSSTLTSLILENSKLDDQNMPILAAGLDAASNIPLLRLYLRCNQIGDDGLQALCPFLEKTTTLEKLDLSQNCISSTGAVTLFRALHRNPKQSIVSINLAHNAIGGLNDDVFGIKHFLLENRSLRVLNLVGNHIQDGSIEAIAEGLKRNNQTRLKHLYLGRNNVGDEGAIALAEMLETNTSLLVLGLGENYIKNSGARALLYALDENTTIKDISGLWRNKIDRRYITIAIRQLLLSEKPSEETLKKLFVQSPWDKEGRGMSGFEFTESLSTPISNAVSEFEDDDQSVDFPTGPLETVLEQETEPLEDEAKIQPPRLIPEAALPVDAGNTIGSVDPERAAHGGVSIFQSFPLVYPTEEMGLMTANPLHDYVEEASVVREALGCNTESQLDVQVVVATKENLESFSLGRSDQILHFSCSGYSDALILEDSRGEMYFLKKDELSLFLDRLRHSLRLVVVTSPNAEVIAQQFLEVGVPHVVSCRLVSQYRDDVGIEFLQHFYCSLSRFEKLGTAFDSAQSAVESSSRTRLLRRVTDRFRLWPLRADNTKYHDVDVLPSTELRYYVGDNKIHQPLTSMLPQVPKHFLGREVFMHKILEALQSNDIVRVAGPPATGKESVVAATCHYLAQRPTIVQTDQIFWLPPPAGVIPEEDTLFGDICLCMNILKSANPGFSWEDDIVLLEAQARIEVEIEDIGTKLFVVVDERVIPRSGREGLEQFVSFLLNGTRAQIVLLSNQSSDAMSSVSNFSQDSDESPVSISSLNIGPLGLWDTARLFGSVSRFIANSGCPAAHDANEFADLVSPSHMSKFQEEGEVTSQRRDGLYSRMGFGFPAAVVEAATNMTKEGFIEMIGVANKPDIFVQSLRESELQIQRRTRQREKALREKNFLRAMDIDDILEELHEMKDKFPTLQELEAERDQQEANLRRAIERQQYEKVTELRKATTLLRKQIRQEQQPPSDTNNAANEMIGNLQARVQTLMKDSKDYSSRTLSGTATFCVHCDQHRDCSFVIYSGQVHEFDHPAMARGIVIWTNENCDLSETSIGRKTLELAGPSFEQDLLELPVVISSSYGPVRCGTGNAVLVGPAEYGDLNAPVAILAVGPVTQRDTNDAVADPDTDSLHYILSMLRSCYRSSIVLARHSQLQAVALNMLTTTESGTVCEQMLRVGLQTLAEEVKFSHLRDLHIVTSSQTEFSLICDILEDMGHSPI